MIESISNAPVLDTELEYTYNVYSSGSVFMSRPMLTKIPCLMNLHHFPFDVQDCYFSVGSWAYDGYEVDVKPYLAADGATYVATQLDLYEANTEFALLKVTSSDYDTFYSCCPEPYPLIRFDLKFARYPLTYFSGIVLPLVLVTISGFLAFVVNPDAGERISLGITVLLTNAAIYLVASDQVPRIGVWTLITHAYMSALICSIVTLMTSIVSVSLYNVKESKGALSEGSMLRLFKDQDANGDEVLSIRELRVGMVAIGMTHEQQEQLIEGRGEAVEVTFHEWYGIVSRYSESDGFASHHSPFIGWIVRRAVRHERAKRIAKVATRASSKSLLRTMAVGEGAPTMADTLCSADVDVDADDCARIPVQISDSEDGNGNGTSFDRRDTMLEKASTVTEHELSDPSELAAKRVAGLIDFYMSMLVPLFYLIYTAVILSNGMHMDVDNNYRNVNADAPCVHQNLPE